MMFVHPKKRANTPSSVQSVSVLGTVTQQEAEGAVCQTGSFMREGARDNQPSPASLFLSQHNYYTVLQAKKPELGPVIVLVGCPVMKVSARFATK